MFAVNHLEYFLLTILLLDRIKQNAPARIVNVSSNMRKGASIKLDPLGGECPYGGMSSYGQSKPAKVLFTQELAADPRAPLSPSTVFIVAGLLPTSRPTTARWSRAAWKLIGLFLRRPKPVRRPRFTLRRRALWTASP